MGGYFPSNRFYLGPILSAIIGVHLLAFMGLMIFPPSWGYFLTALFIGYVQGMGITMVYHRGLTHRAFEFRNRWVERFFVTLASLALQNGPIWWCSLHRIHHRVSDTPGDPHNSKMGFWYSHILWLGYLDPRWKIPSRVNEYGENIKDLSADPYYRWLDRYYYLPYLLFNLMLLLAGGWILFFWGGVIATVMQWHSTFAVNSFGHYFGYRSFNTTDTSTNFWGIGLLTMGEGWHNNHHAFPSSAKTGFMKWWELDVTYLCILLLKKTGLIKSMRVMGEKKSVAGPGIFYQRQGITIPADNVAPFSRNFFQKLRR